MNGIIRRKLAQAVDDYATTCNEVGSKKRLLYFKDLWVLTVYILKAKRSSTLYNITRTWNIEKLKPNEIKLCV